MKKRWIGMVLMAVALVGAPQAALLAEFTFDSDATDTAGGHDGILGAGASVAGGVLSIDTAGGYMDLAATFGAVNPFGGSSDFRIEMEFKTTGGCNLITSATPGQNPDLTHDLSVWVRGNREWIYYDNYYLGDPRIAVTGIKDGTWKDLLITYEAASHTVTLTCDGVTFSSVLDPSRDASLDTVRLGGSVQADMNKGSVAGMAFDNVRIYDTVEGMAPPAGLTVDPAAMEIAHIVSSVTSTSSVDVSYVSTMDMDITISISDQTHPDAFSVLSATNQTLTTPSPATTALEFQFDNAEAGLAIGETATGLVTIAWSEVGGGTNGQVLVPISATAEEPPPNQPPSFTSDPINKIAATKDVAYGGTIANDASDPEGDPMTFTFSEVSGPGPSWLSVSANGVLSGTPGAANVGDHVFTVQVDATGGSDTATLNITVNAEGGVVVYHDTFDNDGLALNAGIGGGLEAVSYLDNGAAGTGINWVDNGDLSRAAGTAGDRAVVSSLNSFDLSQGFTLTVKWTGTDSQFGDSFGLSPTKWTTGSQDPFGYGGVKLPSDYAFYSIGLAYANSGDFTEDKGLIFNDASGTSAQRIRLSDAQTIPASGDNTLVLTVTGNQYSYSVNGAPATTGEIDTTGTFDLSQPFYFNAYSQDGATTITEVLLEVTPAEGLIVNPAAIAISHDLLDVATTSAVNAYHFSATNMEISVSISDQTDPGAFSVLSATNQILTDAYPATTPLEFKFDNTLAGLTYEETSTGLVTIVWSEQGAEGSNGVVLVPISATVPPPEPVSVHPLFCDSMVLQRDIEAPIWGTDAAPGAVVTVRLDGSIVGSTVADSHGAWMVKMASHAHDGGVPHVVTVSSDGRTDTQFNDVVFGEVYIASGQSNMAWNMGRATGYDQELATADSYPLIRQFFQISGASATKQEEPDLVDGMTAWRKCDTSSISDFSAVGYFFAKQVYLETGVPVGLLFAAYGGRSINRFVNPEGLTVVPELSGFMQHGELGGLAVSDIYNQMIYSIMPYGLRGVIWYQGEADKNDGDIYRNKMQALLRGWRQTWGQGDFPFYYVQLTGYNSTTAVNWPYIRQAQFGALSEPNSGMAVTIDVGSANNIHPGNKTDVGRRLARWTLDKDLGVGQTFSGPLYAGAEIEGGQIRILFDYADEGLFVGQKTGTDPVLPVYEPLQNFQIAGADRIFTDATAVIDRDTVVVSSPSVPSPLYVRYIFDKWPAGSNMLYNEAGLPASPFRTDEDKILTVISGTGSGQWIADEVVSIEAAAPAAGTVFDRWIGAASELADLNSSTTTLTMPDHGLYLLATYRSTADPVYTLTVNGGYGSGTSQSNSILNIEAAAVAGQTFDHWSGDTQTVVNVSAAHTTLRMPAGNVTVTAVYRTTDSVGDGIDDVWRAEYFGGDGSTTNSQSAASADPDNDGMTNEQEFRSGTSPIAPGSALGLSGTLEGSGLLTLRFPTVSGYRYRLEKTDTLTPVLWAPILYNIAGDDGEKEYPLNIEGETNGFYRVRLN